MTQFLDTFVDKSLTSTGTWTDIDLSSDIPVGATGAIFKVINTATSNDLDYGFRKKGSSDDRYKEIESGAQAWHIIGVDSNRICQGKIQSTFIAFRLVGYTEADVTMLTTGIDKSIFNNNSWTDMDLSAQLPAGAKAAIFEVINKDSTLRSFGLRKKGSTDEHFVDLFATTLQCSVIGVDADRKCQGKAEWASQIDFWLIGYLTMGIAETNAIDRSLGSTGSYIDITESDAPAGATGVFVNVISTSAWYFAARKNGASDDTYRKATSRQSLICTGLDANKKWEGKIQSTSNDFYTLGYFVAGGGKTTVQGTIIG